ncbi:cytochrome ubiquinol oxidase subunit I [Calderihabitans maritimus]|uniref:Cytochrome bd ubiquinol oxidase, subunit i n=1 Tax=Calderihabitans maritimus TaxID=1246530 RepID=A0A1Z5HP91_9FIRM|nr:cytochrome ubiquinol oxidase subunit I [Calderihabitans maritimus]GAW91197.1 cytochrome bd ubiquinol oxidase, subunit i [Calderihabitans maritimus]
MGDAVLLSKIQFAVSVGFHYLFPPLTIGMAWIIFFMQSMYLKTKNEQYDRMAYFWIKIFAISFVIGVASGVVMEFQFGTNWSEYSRFVGDVFGAPLAAEGVFAFFLESVFVGVLIWGKDRVSQKLYWVSSLMVAIGSTLSAFWIIVANSWMQTPAGYHVVNGRAELTNFFAAVFNPSTVPRYLHVIDGALITGSFFIMGISAYLLLKEREITFAKKSLKIALTVAVVASLLQLPLGHFHAVQVAETQPVKLAAYEGLFDTTAGAPLSLFGIPNAEAETTYLSVNIPKMLSFLVAGDTSATIKGLKEFPREEWPPLGITFQSYHLMVLLGIYFLAITVFGIFLLSRKKLYNNKTFLKVLMYSIPLPFLTNELGWIAAEVGRQPWIVYNVMKTNEAASIVVPGIQVLLSLVVLSLIYAILFSIWIFLLKRKLHVGVDEPVISGKQEEVTS